MVQEGGYDWMKRRDLVSGKRHLDTLCSKLQYAAFLFLLSILYQSSITLFVFVDLLAFISD